MILTLIHKNPDNVVGRKTDNGEKLNETQHKLIHLTIVTLPTHKHGGEKYHHRRALSCEIEKQHCFNYYYYFDQGQTQRIMILINDSLL